MIGLEADPSAERGTPGFLKDRWAQLNQHELWAAKTLGFTPMMWDNHGWPITGKMPWRMLSTVAQQAASVLGFDPYMHAARWRHLARRRHEHAAPRGIAPPSPPAGRGVEMMRLAAT